MIATILESLRRPAASSQDFRTKLAEIDAALPEAEGALRQAEQDRAAGLLTMSDAEVEKIEARMARALRDRDRLRAARDEAERRLADAEAAEAGAELDRERAAIEARAAKLASRLRPEYEKHATALVSLLTDLAQAEQEIRDLNFKLGSAGRHSDALPPVEPRAIDPGGNLPELVSIVAMTSLRPVGACPGWGAASRAADALGLKS